MFPGARALYTTCHRQSSRVLLLLPLDPEEIWHIFCSTYRREKTPSLQRTGRSVSATAASQRGASTYQPCSKRPVMRRTWCILTLLLSAPCLVISVFVVPQELA